MIKNLARETGSTLLEVLVAVVVLALTGTALVSGIYLSSAVSNDATSKSNTLTVLDDLGQQLTAMPFQDCSHGDPYVLPNPTNSLSEKLNPSSLKLEVQVLNPDFVTNTSNEQWISCVASASTSGVQRLILSAKPAGNSGGQIFTKVVVKVRG